MNKLEEFELFLANKYHNGEMEAKEYSQINLLLGEFASIEQKEKSQ